EGAPKCLGSDPAGSVHALPDAGDDHVPGEILQVPLVREAGHQEPDRVRPEIDRGDAAVRLLLVNRTSSFQLLADPLPNWVRAARQVVREVGVQALHTSGRAADPTPRLRPGVDPPSLLGVFGMSP